MEGVVYRVAKQSEGDPYEFIMSDETVDRYGDVITASGWDIQEFQNNPIALLNHNTNAIIGRWEKVRVEGKRLLGRLVLAAEGTSEEVDKVRRLWSQKILRMVSVGFMPVEHEPLNKGADDWGDPVRYLKQKLLECSLVAIPANPNAGPVSRSLALPTEVRRQIFGKLAMNDLPTGTTAVPGKLATPPLRAIPMRSNLITKKIEAQQSEVTRLADQLNGLLALDELDAEQRNLHEQLPGVLNEAKAQLELLLASERALGQQAAAAAGDDDGTSQQRQQSAAARPFAVPRKKINPEDYVFRAAAASLRAFSSGTALDAVIRENYGSDEAMQIIVKAAVNPAMTTVPGYAQELVQTGFGAFMDKLLAASLYAPLSDAGVRYDLGKNGLIKIPYRQATPTASGAWVGEGAPKPVKRIGLATVELKPHKLSVITTFTEEMANSSVPAIEGILRKAMADDTQASLDGYLIDAIAEAATRPAGLLFGVTPIVASAAGTALEKIVADINALIAPMEAAGGGGKVVLLMNPAQARRIGMVQTTTGDFAFTGGAAEAASKFGIDRVISSITIPAGRVIAVDANWFATATGDLPRFAVSTEATLHEEDTTPLALGVAGTPNVVAAPMRSLFQTDSIAIRLSLYVTWVMTRPGMVQTIAAVGW